jgi:transposase
VDLEAEVRRLAALVAERDAEIAEHAIAIAEHAIAIAERDAAIANMRHSNDVLRARAEAAEDAATRLQREVERLRRQIVGPTSERVVDPNQLPLPIPPPMHHAGGKLAEPAQPEREDRADRSRGKRGRTSPGRRDVAAMNHLRTLVFERRVEDRTCPCGCGAAAETIGFDVSWRLERVPAEIVRHKVMQEKVAFPDHAGAQAATLVTAPGPVAYALPKALCGNELLAQVVIDKYADHLPLHRQAERFLREGFDLSRQTLCDWCMDLAELATPIVQRLALEVRGGPWLRADATGMPVMDRGRVKGRVHHGHLWAWGNYETVVFTYTPDKTALTVRSLFDGFAGVVLIDGASDFNLLDKAPGVERAGCWAHARRKLYEALTYDSRLALTGLAAIRQLFVGERVVMAAPIAQRLALRRELCEPVLAGIRRWVDEQLPRQIPRTPTHAALQYIHNQWKRLCVFLQHAEIACHNNDTERDLRRPVKGRDNFNFAGSPRGARAAAVFYTLIGTCLLQGADPRRYLVEILGRLDEPASRLTPHAVRERWESLANDDDG